ncbi:hypothetical protein KFE25_000783 [Diacronema lutheri]|mgnify:CR=1 FL=1|uniref:Phosphodiesterase n=1 Tax=Diacronema lutheri TaxID=2081491 RepID=A0A8J6CAC3_DIALT|nr:hypothetical protein KFE25_000783 [Diacronema lutheri]
MGEPDTVAIVIAAVVAAVGTACACALLFVGIRVQRSRPMRVKTGAPIREPGTLFELGVSHLERLIADVDGRSLSRLLVGDIVADLRLVLLELRTLAETDRLLDPISRGANARDLASDEFASNWFTLGMGGEQYQRSARVQDDVRPEDSASQHGRAEALAPHMPHGGAMTMPISPLHSRVPNASLELLSWIRDGFHEWDFDLKRLRSWCGSAGVRPLLAITLAMHTTAAPDSLAQLLGASEHALITFIQRVVGGYRQLPYHSEIHACDVMHAATVMHRAICGTSADPHETGAVILAAIVHDLAHPGVNNAFLIATHSPLAVRYNDSSVLENYHVSLAFAIMLGYDRRTGGTGAGGAPVALDPLAGLDKAAYKRVRAEMIALVLATSFENHFVHIGNLKGRAKAAAASSGLASVPEPDDKHAAEERLMLVKMIVKAADIGHPARAWAWHVDSAQRACAEFFHQGECEARAGLPVSPLNNASECNLSKAQTGFLEFMVRPAFDVLRMYVEASPQHAAPGALRWLQTPFDHLERNINAWKQMEQHESATLKEEICEIPIAEPFNAQWFSEFAASEPGTVRPSPAQPPSMRAARSSDVLVSGRHDADASGKRLRMPFFATTFGAGERASAGSRKQQPAAGAGFPFVSRSKSRPREAEVEAPAAHGQHAPPASTFTASTP